MKTVLFVLFAILILKSLIAFDIMSPNKAACFALAGTALWGIVAFLVFVK